MDVGTGSGILATWAAQAGAKRVYAIEYTDMAKHAKNLVKANGVDHIVTVIQGAVEDVELPIEDWEKFGLALEVGDVEMIDVIDGIVDESCREKDSEDGNCSNVDGTLKTKKNQRVVDIIISEWMGYFLLRESMLDSLIRARDTFLKPKSGLVLPSHATMLLAPIVDEEDRKGQIKEYSEAMAGWREFVEQTNNMYGVDMSCLEEEFEKEQREYYVMSSRWTQLGANAVLAEPSLIKTLDMATCTLEDAKGVGLLEQSADGSGELGVPFEFDMPGKRNDGGNIGPISGFAGWFTVDFKSRTDDIAKGVAPEVPRPAHLSTGPEIGREITRCFV